VEGAHHIGLNTLSGRCEGLQVETALLQTDMVVTRPAADVKDPVFAFTVGGVRDVLQVAGFQGGIGADVSFYGLPNSLQSPYGNRPVSFHVFFRIRARRQDQWDGCGTCACRNRWPAIRCKRYASPTQGVAMKRLITFTISLFVVGTVVFAHGGNEHVRGVVTQISAQSITVQTSPKVTKTLVLSDKTTFKQGGKTAHLVDLKVGDRVVIDVPEKTTQALLIQIGAATTTSAHK
jgi:hypothetical protein